MFTSKKSAVVLVGITMMFVLTGCETNSLVGDGDNPPAVDNSYTELSSAVENTFLSAATDDFDTFCKHVTLESDEAAKRYLGGEAGTCAAGWQASLQDENILGTDEGWTVTASNLPDEKSLRGEDSVSVYVYESEEDAEENAGTNTWVVFENGYAGGANIGFTYEDDVWKVSSTP